jgi:enediyne biosynthesis protein E4
MLSRRDVLRILGCSAFGQRYLQPAAFRLAGNSLSAFEEIPAKTSGITWVHDSGPSPDMYLPETTGAGCAFLDYDNDGWMDIYLVNSGPCDFYKPRVPIRNALYRNNRDGTFTDVTEKAGVPGNAYGMGIAVGDYDGDGFPDLYVSQYPRSILYHNNGDGTFTDVTEKAGVAAPGMPSSAVWFDYDNDGRLDLFVCRFGNFEKATNIACMSGQHTRVYCKPTPYIGRPCWLFHNNGDGTFTDVSKKSGIAASPAKAWGVVAADINNDGWMDLFVSNDTLPNFLFANRRGRFEEIGLLAGVGLSTFGLPRSGMGVDAADYDQDGWIDLCVSNVDHEQYSLYHNEQNEAFNDLAAITGIGAATKLMSGWGLKFFDFDNDGNLDLFLANGHPDPSVEQRFPELRYAEPPLLFRNNGKTFQNISGESGPIFTKSLAARGMALGDFDNDGAVDVLLTQNDGPPVLLRNTSARNNHWLGVRLVGKTANIDAIGAKLTYQAGDLTRHVFKVGGGSYLSSHDPRIVLGLGTNTKLNWLEIQWPKPSDRVERFTDLPVDRYVTIVEGQGGWK